MRIQLNEQEIERAVRSWIDEVVDVDMVPTAVELRETDGVFEAEITLEERPAPKMP